MNLMLRLILIAAFCLATAATHAQSAWTTIVEEHFDALTDGTEDAPSTTSLLDDYGWVIDVADWARFAPECTYGWGGHDLYSAGGAIAAMKGGFLNTPTGDYSGNLRMTCRLRLVKGQDLKSAPLDIVLMRRSKFEDHKRITVNLTEDWQNITFTADNGWFEDDVIQFFTMDSFDYLIDDIVIEHQVKAIPVPEIGYPTDITESGFTANWMPSNGAEEYLLNVYTKTPNPESYDAHAEGMLERSEDEVVSAYSEEPLTACSVTFSVDDHGMPIEMVSNELLNISALTNNGWIDWLTVSVDVARQMGGGPIEIDMTKYLAIFGEVHQAKFTLKNCDGTTVILSDIAVHAAGAPILDYLLKEKPVGNNTSYKVEGDGFDPDADYWYSVKAVGERYNSAVSEEQFVFTVSNPLTLNPTDVTSSGFTAHWQCGRKAEGFRIDCINRYTAADDSPEYVVLEEDFSRVHSDGTVDAPELGTPTSVYESIDDYTTVGGWTAASLQMAEGMLGGMPQYEGCIAGAISTPVIDLSHNNGICRVSIVAYGVPGDGIAIQGSDFNAFNIVQFDETGYVEATVDLPLCTSSETLTFYSYSYSPFLIDYVCITQPLRAGDVVETTVHSQRVVDADAREARVDTSTSAGGELYYRVLAYRTDPTDYSSIEYFSQFPNSVSVGLIDGLTTLTAPVASQPVYYDLSGRRVEAASTGGVVVSRGRKLVSVSAR